VERHSVEQLFTAEERRVHSLGSDDLVVVYKD
jgi:hypothetical protein